MNIAMKIGLLLMATLTTSTQSEDVVFPPPSMEDVEQLCSPDVRAELLEMVAIDQRVRKSIQCNGGECSQPESTDENMPSLAEVDRKNTARMKQLVSEYGWLTRSMVGEDGMHAAWLLVQHADHDVDFQERCLRLMTIYLGSGEISTSDYAYLTDRVLVNRGQMQVYGTQFWSPNGKLEPRPIKEAAKVDERRKQMGLNSLAEYAASLDT
ncbi:MAG: DUF6624 domain-containing protein [Phycisphaerae bacterium]